MRFFFRLLNIREEEQGRALQLFFYNFLVVATYVQGRIISDTLFLKRYDITQLPLMYILVAVSVSVLTWFYTRRSSLYRLDTLIRGVLLLSMALTLIFVALIHAGFRFSYPGLYVLVEVIGAFMTFQFWSFTNELLDSREAKRTLGFIGVGGIIASLVAGYSVKWLVHVVQVENLLFVNIMFMALSFYLVYRIGETYKSKLQRSVVIRSVQKTTVHAPVRLFDQLYFRYIALITVLTFTLVNFVDYQFKMEAREHFTEQELAGFFGMVYAFASGFFSLFFQVVATSWLLRWSIFLSLLILPAMITGFSTLFLVMPGIWFITMARASDFAFRYTVNDAAVQLLYIPVDQKYRSRAKAVIDGILKPLVAGVAGLMIYGFSYFGVAHRYISIVVVIGGVLWGAAILVLRKEYLAVLQDNIKKKRIGSEDMMVKQTMIESVIVEAMTSENEDEVLMALDLIEKGRHFYLGRYFLPLLSENVSAKVKTKILRILRTMESRFYTYDILRLMKSDDEEVVKDAILTYAYMQMEKSHKVVSSFLESESLPILSSAIIALIKYCGITGVMTAAPYLKRLAESSQPERRSAAAYILGEIGQQNMQQQVFEFLNDRDPQVRREAVKAATKVKAEGVIPKLLFMLTDRAVSLDAAKALTSFGDRVIPPAKSILENSLENFELKVAVAKMLGDIPSREVAPLLMENLYNQSDELRSALLESLKRIMSRTEYTVLLDQSLLRRYLYREFYLYFQHLYYKEKIRAGSRYRYLVDVMDTKLLSCIHRIFSLLSIMYGQKLFDSIYFNLSQKNISKEQRSVAVELIDNIVDKDIRRILVPLVEAADEREKLAQGFASFKIKTYGYHEILEICLTDDNDWVRAVTLYLIAVEGIADMADKVGIFMYDPSPIVRETALYASSRLKSDVSEDDLNFLLSDGAANVSSYAAWYVASLRGDMSTEAQYAYDG